MEKNGRKKSKQEDYHSKLARDMHNFYHSGHNGVNAYGGNNHGSANFTPKRHIGVGNFSPDVITFEHNSYESYEGNRLGARNRIHVVVNLWKENDGSFKVLKVHPCDLVETTSENDGHYT
ncbi:hypothetical protein M9H77_35722 [Catharanthus roseus]|uniref:Uncharacterized protein n=1 Tax=Catharanthus roseus TaxID=4058 RepID=A0ACB9ZPT3_CATRO|nr:hypothetical protein M9H77_35722 [Catharanthus roseus]